MRARTTSDRTAALSQSAGSAGPGPGLVRVRADAQGRALMPLPLEETQAEVPALFLAKEHLGPRKGETGSPPRPQPGTPRLPALGPRAVGEGPRSALTVDKGLASCPAGYYGHPGPPPPAPTSREQAGRARAWLV